MLKWKIESMYNDDKHLDLKCNGLYIICLAKPRLNLQEFGSSGIQLERTSHNKVKKGRDYV